MMGLTERQADILTYLRAQARYDDVMPSFTELMNHFGIRSRAEVHRLLTALEDRGHIRRMKGRARAIELIESKCPHCGKLI